MNSFKIVNNTLFLSGELVQSTVPNLLSQIEPMLKKEHPVMIDIAQVSKMDSSGVALLDEIQAQLQTQSGITMLSGVPENLKPMLETFTSLKLKSSHPPLKDGFLVALGGACYTGFSNLKEALVLAADIYFWSFVGLVRHKGQRKGSLYQQGVLLGVNALPIVALLSFIIGFILALQSAVQLRNFGANVFIADLLAVTMVREMGPMLTAIIVAGRSGSAIASEIATMQVTEEIDALKMMAINPIRYVIVPKFHAISLVMPVLVAFSILVGELGGALVALSYLDLSIDVFVNRTIEIITLKDLIVSFGKSTFFAWVIVIIGSYFGFQVKGGAEGVGKATTASVVASIFAVIVFDAVFSLLYL